MDGDVAFLSTGEQYDTYCTKGDPCGCSVLTTTFRNRELRRSTDEECVKIVMSSDSNSAFKLKDKAIQSALHTHENNPENINIIVS